MVRRYLINFIDKCYGFISCFLFILNDSSRTFELKKNIMEINNINVNKNNHVTLIVVSVPSNVFGFLLCVLEYVPAHIETIKKNEWNINS